MASHGKHFGKQINKKTKLRIRNIIAKTALKFDSEAGILEKRGEQREQAAQMKLLRHLLGITYYIRSRRKSIRSGETWSAGHCSGNRTLSKKWLQHTHTGWSETGYPSRHCSINRKTGRPRKGWGDQLHLEG
jgi:hypothetical protein